MVVRRVTKWGGEACDRWGGSVTINMFLFRAFLNLQELVPEVSHNMWVPIKDRLEGNYCHSQTQANTSLDSHRKSINYY